MMNPILKCYLGVVLILAVRFTRVPYFVNKFFCHSHIFSIAGFLFYPWFEVKKAILVFDQKLRVCM